MASVGVTSTTQILSAVGAGVPIRINSRQSGTLEPGIICVLSAGASMTYNVEISGDDPLQPAPNGTWAPFTGMSALTATAVATLGAAVIGVRVHITAYVSGTLTFQLIQQIESR